MNSFIADCPMQVGLTTSLVLLGLIVGSPVKLGSSCQNVEAKATGESEAQQWFIFAPVRDCLLSHASYGVLFALQE